MSSLEGKTFDAPDEVRAFQANGRVDLVHLDSGPVGRGTFEPGWRWSNDVKPLAGTDSCQVRTKPFEIPMDHGDGEFLACEPIRYGAVSTLQ